MKGGSTGAVHKKITWPKKGTCSHYITKHNMCHISGAKELAIDYISRKF